MNNLKLYELIKSNEPNSTVFYYELQKIKRETETIEFSVMLTVLEALFSAFLANELSDAFNIIDPSDTTNVIIISILLVLVIFSTIFVEFHLFVLITREIIKNFQNNKNSRSHRDFLAEIVYKDIINNLMTAQSLHRKSSDNENTNGEDIASFKILRCCESIYYLQKALDAIKENQIILFLPDDISIRKLNKRHRDYVEFLIQIDPDVLIIILDIALDLVENIKKESNTSEIIKNKCNAIKLLIDKYKTNLSNIQKNDYYIKLTKFECEESE